MNQQMKITKKKLLLSISSIKSLYFFSMVKQVQFACCIKSINMSGNRNKEAFAIEEMQTQFRALGIKV